MRLLSLGVIGLALLGCRVERNGGLLASSALTIDQGAGSMDLNERQIANRVSRILMVLEVIVWIGVAMGGGCAAGVAWRGFGRMKGESPRRVYKRRQKPGDSGTDGAS